MNKLTLLFLLFLFGCNLFDSKSEKNSIEKTIITPQFYKENCQDSNSINICNSFLTDFPNFATFVYYEEGSNSSEYQTLSANFPFNYSLDTVYFNSLTHPIEKIITSGSGFISKDGLGVITEYEIKGIKKMGYWDFEGKIQNLNITGKYLIK